MIKMPPEVIDAAVNAYAGVIWDADARPLDYRHAMTAAIAAALTAWPGMHLGHQCTGCGGDPQIVLPLPQEARDE